MDGLFAGKSDLEMDDNLGYSHSRKPPYESVRLYYFMIRKSSNLY